MAAVAARTDTNSTSSSQPARQGNEETKTEEKISKEDQEEIVVEFSKNW